MENSRKSASFDCSQEILDVFIRSKTDAFRPSGRKYLVHMLRTMSLAKSRVMTCTHEVEFKKSTCRVLTVTLDMSSRSTLWRKSTGRLEDSCYCVFMSESRGYLIALPLRPSGQDRQFSRIGLLWTCHAFSSWYNETLELSDVCII